GTGRVRALATNRIFSNDQSSNGVSTNRARRAAGEPGSYPSTTLPLITGGAGVPGFQAGSAFKVFTMIAALERGYPLAYEIDAEDVARTSYIVDPGSPAACPGTHFYCPRNAGEETGTYTMWGAFGRSVNTYFVPLQERVGAGKVVEVAQRLGLTFRSESDARLAARANANQWGAFTLGVSASTPLDMATAWAALAADGRYCAPTPVVAILDLDGNPVDAGNPRCQDGTVARDVARAAIDAARCPVGDRSPTSQCVGATAGDLRGIVGKPLAGKTGTTDGDSTATMTMTTRQLAISGYLVDPDWPAHPGVGDHGIINDAVAYTLRDAMSGHPAIDFTSPSRAIVSGTW
ncbi:MAG: glycosyl transferase, partial [Micromonosporaceae bacterium]|nr:glycosyl transferase [Micromonosporaceae bacterium]